MMIPILSVSVAAHALSLDEAEHMATGNSHDLKRASLEAESAKWSTRNAYAGYLPKLDLAANHLFSEKFEELEVPFGGETFVMPAIQPYTLFGVRAKWNIFTGLSTKNEVSAASLAEQAAQRTLARTNETLRVDIRTKFYQALGAQTLVDVAEQNIQTLQGHLNDVNSRVRGGVLTRFDVLRSEVQLEDAQTEKIAAIDMAAVARARLFQALGITDDGKPLSGHLPDQWDKLNFQNISAESARRDDREALRLTTERENKLTRLANSNLSPRISLFGGEEWYNNINHSIWETDERFKQSYSVGVEVSWNIFDGGASYAKEQQAALSEQAANERLKQADQAVPVDIDQWKRRLSYSVTNYKAKLSSIRKAEESVRLAKSGLRAGIRTNTEVLDAVVDLNRAKAVAVRSQVEAVEALGQLELAVGYAIER
jgi:outer membrane protein TolC